MIFLGYRVGLDSVLGAEFIKPVELLVEVGTDAYLLVLCPVGELLRRDLRLRWQQRSLTFPAKLKDRIRRFPVAPSRFESHVDESWLLAQAIRYGYSMDARIILHAVGSGAGYLAVRARRFLRERDIRVVFRSHGPSADEYLYREGGPARRMNEAVEEKYARLQRQENEAYCLADAVVTLSEPMRQFAIRQRGGSQMVASTGCLADVGMFGATESGREQVRNALGWGSDLVVVHSGTLHPWQRPDEVVRMFERIHSIEPRSRLLMLTRDFRVFEEALRDSNVPNDRCTIRGLEFAEVPRFLAAADIGLIGRGLLEVPNIVNEFSWPIKFAEYLAAGCPVIMGERVGDLSDMAKTNGLGLVVPHDLAESELRRRLQEFLRKYAAQGPDWRRKCQAFASTNLDVHGAIARYRDLYATLAS